MRGGQRSGTRRYGWGNVGWRPAGDCVWLEPEADDIWYLGSLSIDPRRQNKGLGRNLLAAAEDWVRQ
jgi:GNAT superfamily N-acetyltransferase